MTWITLQPSIVTEYIETQRLTDALTDVSREERAYAREFSLEKTLIQNDQQRDLREAREEWDDLREQRPEVGSADYEEWQEEFELAQEEYAITRQEIQDYSEMMLSQVENEANDVETALGLEKTQIETQLEARKAELSTLEEASSQDIKDSAIKLGS